MKLTYKERRNCSTYRKRVSKMKEKNTERIRSRKIQKRKKEEQKDKNKKRVGAKEILF